MTDAPETPLPERPLPEAPPEAPLWADLKDAIRAAFGVWGDPAGLLAHRPLRPHEATLLRDWLASFESIVRALLTSMALRLIPTLPPPRPRGSAARGSAARAARPAESAAPAGAEGAPGAETGEAAAGGAEVPRSAPQDGGQDAPAADEAAPSEPPGSESWSGVRFQLVPLPRKGRPAKRGRSVHGQAPRPMLLRMMARRFEAIIRVAVTPEPYALRLARRLAADRYLAARVLTRPKTDGVRAVLYDDIIEDALALAWEALRALPPAPDPSPAPSSGSG